MARSWVLLLAGVALLQGVCTFNPLPLLEEEEAWEKFSRELNDASFRLPTTTMPMHYELSLTPYFEDEERPFTFDGTVAIYTSATEENVSEIVIHCNDLTIHSLTVEHTDAEGVVQQIAAPQTYQCEAPQSFLRIATIEPLQVGQEYIIRSSFTGNLQSNMNGFYRSWYRDSTTTRWMATTQFQPGYARQAFPCYDEPGFKATFDITMNREPDFSPTISNMPIKTTENTTDGRISETFYTTPITSTYLLAFIVSHYDKVETNNDEDRPFDIYARDNANGTGAWSLEIGMKLLEAMENYTDYPYYTMAEKINMKQAAIPDFNAGAMENWGLLTYREALILYDPLNSNHFYKQRVANIVSHEIAHMWFGNLVTCAWWGNLWLNEGFARFYQYFLTGSVAPELGYERRFMVEQYISALSVDSVDSAHALTNPDVYNPTTVWNHFSTITYARGACILRMTQYLLGQETYVKGLRSYLKERAFDVAEPHHLFNALDAAAREDGALAAYGGITIDRYFRTWSEKAGHPMLSVTIDQRTGTMQVTQARWERTTGSSAFPGIWDIPITWTREGAADFDDLKPSQFLTAQSTVIERGTEGLEWVIFNKQASGFYRVNYDDTNWALIVQALRNNPNVIHEFNRVQIIDDLFNMGRAGVRPYQQVFNLLSFLQFDDEYGPWIAAIDGFNFVLRRLAHDEANLQKLRDIINKELSVAVTGRLGYVEVENETFMNGILRMYLMNFLCDNGHEECIATGIEKFAEWKAGGFIPANMRPWVYCTGLRFGDAEDFEFFWNRYLQEDLAGEQIVMLQNAGCTRDEASLRKFLDAIVSQQNIVRDQDFTTALNSAVSKNEYNTMRAFAWLKDNVNQTTEALGGIATPLSYIVSRLLNEQDMAEVQTWLDENQDSIGTAYNTGVNGIASSRNNLAWSARRMPEVYEYFDNGVYVEYEIEDPTQEEVTTEESVTVTPPELDIEVTTEVDDESDSANIAALSIFTLIISVSINLIS
uniref:Aminopeptidase n=1 Tax=Ostrinia nubilalis TaxID=29057 RepID=G3ESV3_OSTNU|nr:aminopeptidase N1 [Ostrinia nubilalis]